MTERSEDALKATYGQPVALEECPPGPFEFEGGLGFKTEYGMTLPDGPTNIPGDQVRWKVTNRPDAYCLESGEVFWGGAKTHEGREKLLVRPVELTRSEASPPVIDEGVVEKACDALLEALRPHIAAKYPDAVDMDKTWADATEEERAIFIPAMRAALEAGCAGLVAENERQASLLKQALEAIDSRRSEPLFIMRDAIRNHLEDRTALRGDREQGEG